MTFASLRSSGPAQRAPGIRAGVPSSAGSHLSALRAIRQRPRGDDDQRMARLRQAVAAPTAELNRTLTPALRDDGEHLPSPRSPELPALTPVRGTVAGVAANPTARREIAALKAALDAAAATTRPPKPGERPVAAVERRPERQPDEVTPEDVGAERFLATYGRSGGPKVRVGTVQELESLTQHVFRPLSVPLRCYHGGPQVEEAPPRRAATPQDVAELRLEVDGLATTLRGASQQTRKQGRDYVRVMTTVLRDDQGLRRRFNDAAVRHTRAVREERRGHRFEDANLGQAGHWRDVLDEKQQRRREHAALCEERMLGHYDRLEAYCDDVRAKVEEPRLGRGGIPRMWLELLAFAASANALGQLRQVARRRQSQAFIGEISAQFSGLLAEPSSHTPRRRRSVVSRRVSVTPETPAHDKGRRPSHSHALDVLTARLQPIRPHVVRWAGSIRDRAADTIVQALRVREAQSRVKTHLGVFLRRTRSLVRRWQLSLWRENRRTSALALQWDRYMREVLLYDRPTCNDADRELKRRAKALQRAAADRRQSRTVVEAYVAPARAAALMAQRVRKMADAPPETLQAVFTAEELAGAAAERPPFEVHHAAAVTVAAPLVGPPPFGRLGADPDSARTVARQVLRLVNFDRVIWRVPHRVRDFVLCFCVARDRRWFEAEIAAWMDDAGDAQRRFDALIAVCGVAQGPTLARVREELRAFVWPPVPERQVLFAPNEMRVAVALGFALFTQERRQLHERNLPDKTVDPAVVADVYNARNAAAQMTALRDAFDGRLHGVRDRFYDPAVRPVENRDVEAVAPPRPVSDAFAGPTGVPVTAAVKSPKRGGSARLTASYRSPRKR